MRGGGSIFRAEFISKKFGLPYFHLRQVKTSYIYVICKYATNLPIHRDYVQQVTMTKFWSVWLSLIGSSD